MKTYFPCRKHDAENVLLVFVLVLCKTENTVVPFPPPLVHPVGSRAAPGQPGPGPAFEGSGAMSWKPRTESAAEHSRLNNLVARGNPSQPHRSSSGIPADFSAAVLSIPLENIANTPIPLPRERLPTAFIREDYPRCLGVFVLEEARHAIADAMEKTRCVPEIAHLLKLMPGR